MSLRNYQNLSNDQILQRKKNREARLTKEEIQETTYENINKMFKETELTNEEKKAFDEIIENNLKIESNRDFQWVKWNLVTLKLWNNWKSYKIFFPDGTTEYWLDILIEDNKNEFEEIENYFKENWINKPLKTSLLYLLGGIIKSPFWRPEDSSKLNVYDFKPSYNQWENNNAKLLIASED